jgi:hypothetical protein
MFIAASGYFSPSSAGAASVICRSYGARESCATWFYKHAAPTALSNVLFAGTIEDARALGFNSMPLPLDDMGTYHFEHEEQDYDQKTGYLCFGVWRNTLQPRWRFWGHFANRFQWAIGSVPGLREDLQRRQFRGLECGSFDVEHC